MKEPEIEDAGELLSQGARGRIYGGAVLVCRQPPALVTLVEHTAHMLRMGFHPEPPPLAHDALDREDYRSRVLALRKAFATDTGLAHLAGKLIEEVGGSLADGYLDRLKLRIQPPTAAGGAQPLGPLPAHRDTWGSNVYQQINLWAPIYPLDTERTLALYISKWAEPVANDSAVWDLEELRRLAAEGRRGDYPTLPVASEPPPTEARRLDIGPGDIAAFSGAHLHASVENATPFARINVEFRYVSLADVRARRGAPNVDGAAPRIGWRWFKRLGDGDRLEEAVAREPSRSLPSAG